MVGMKRCSRCKQEKPLDEFYLKRPEKNQRASECKDCVSERGKQRWREKGPILRKVRNAVKKEARIYFKDILPDSLKRCSGCNSTKKKSRFTASGWVAGYCRKCVKSRNSKYWSDNLDQLKKDHRKRYENGLKDEIVKANRERRSRQRKKIAELKNAPCTDCGQTFPWYVMEFDHLGKKTHGVGQMVARGWSLERMEEELATCELVCACCHRDRSKRRMPPAKSYRPYEQKKRAFIDSCKNVLCADCGGRFLPHQVDFDHVRGEKVGMLSRLFCRSWDVIRAEIAKTEVCCANCHKARTYVRRQHLQVAS